MGMLVDGAWVKDNPTDGDGSFERAETAFRNWVTRDGAPGPTGEGGFEARSGRYHLYVSLACPWAHRALVVRALKGLQEHIGVSVVHPDMLEDGWSFDDGFPGATGDRLAGRTLLREVYLDAEPQMTGRVTVPVLWDIERGTIVSNESADIIRMLDEGFADVSGREPDLYPEALRHEIDEVNARVYDDVNNGVYKAGFATEQEAYDKACRALFDALDWLEDRLEGRDWLVGDAPTEADWRLFTTLVRFDPVYHGHFKCNVRMLREYERLSAYLLRLYDMPGVAETVDLDHIRRHYHYSHETLNPHRIVPLGPLPRLPEPR